MLRKTLVLTAVVALALFMTLQVMSAAPEAAQLTLERYIVKFKSMPGMSERLLVQSLGGRVLFEYLFLPDLAVELPEQAISALENTPGVIWVAPDIVMKPTDAELEDSWQVKRVEAMITHTKGVRGSGVLLGIIDTGVDYTHPDLSGTRYKGGCDFGEHPDNPCAYPPMDNTGHGTHVAGIALAADNGQDIIGVAPEADYRAYKASDASGTLYASVLNRCIEQAMADNVEVLNMSWGTTASGPALDDMQNLLQQAYDNGMVLVAGAGNGGADEGVVKPAKWSMTIAVGAIDKWDQWADRPTWESAVGPELELVAPGVDIRTTELGGGTVVGEGTSLSSPVVAGVAALIINDGITDQNGNGRVNDEVRGKLIAEAYDLGDPGHDNYYGYGLVKADNSRPEWPELVSSLNIMGSDWASSDTVTIEWYAKGQLIKTTTKTLNSTETTSIYVPSELSGLTNEPEVSAVIKTTSWPHNAIASISDSGPVYAHAYRTPSEDAPQQDEGSQLYAARVPNFGDWINPGDRARIRLVTGVYGNNPSYVPVTIKFYNSDGTIEKTLQTAIENSNTILTIPTADIPFGGEYGISVTAQAGYPTPFSGIVEILSPSGMLSSYPLSKAGSGTIGYVARFMNGYQDWFSYVTVMNVGTYAANIYINYFPDDGTQGESAYASVQPGGTHTFPYWPRGDEGATVLTTFVPTVAMVRTENLLNSARGDSVIDVGVTANYGHAAMNMWNYYGWYCATPLQNGTNSTRGLMTVWRWPGGSATRKEYDVPPFTKRLYLNDLLPPTAVAGAVGRINPFDTYGWVAQLAQCYHNGLYGNRAWNSAEGTPIQWGTVGGWKSTAPIVYTGQ